MTATPDFHWSELQRSPTVVEDAVDKHRKVKILRRGKRSLVLSDVDATATGLLEATAVLAHLVGEAAVLDGIARSAAVTWPWLTFFDDDDRRSFSTELTTTMRACATLGEFTPLDLMLTRWRNTATAIALGVDLRTGVTDDGADVPRPRGRRGRQK